MKFGTKSESFEQVDISFPVTHTKSHRIPHSTAFLGYNSIEFSWIPWNVPSPLPFIFKLVKLLTASSRLIFSCIFFELRMKNLFDHFFTSYHRRRQLKYSTSQVDVGYLPSNTHEQWANYLLTDRAHKKAGEKKMLHTLFHRQFLRGFSCNNQNEIIANVCRLWLKKSV